MNEKVLLIDNQEINKAYKKAISADSLDLHSLVFDYFAIIVQAYFTV